MEPQLRDEANPNRLASVTAWAYSAWPPIAIIVSGLVVAGVTRGYTQLQQLCKSIVCSSPGLPTETLDVLSRAGIAVSTSFAVYGAGMVMLVALLSIGAAALIYFRRQDEPSAIFVVYFLTLSMPGSTGVLNAIQPSTIFSEFISGVLPYIAIVSAAALLFSGLEERLESAWTRAIYVNLTILGVGFQIALTLFVANTPDWTSLIWLHVSSLFYLWYALIPITFGVLYWPPRRSYNLWPAVKWPLIFGGLALLLVRVYLPVINVLGASLGLTDTRLQVFIVLTMLALITLSYGMREWVGYQIARALFPERVDFRATFTTFANEVRTVVDLDELLSILVNRTTDLFKAEQGAVYLCTSDQHLSLVKQRNISDDDLRLGESALARLKRGEVILQGENPSLLLLVPLGTPSSLDGSETSRMQLLGVLVLGQKSDGKPYTRSDRGLLLNLAGQAGTAIFVAQLVKRQREEAARRVEYENSPRGRAEIVSKTLGQSSEMDLLEILRLANAAGDDSDTRALFDHLPHALSDKDLAGFTEGCCHILDSQRAPELLPVGLRQIAAYVSRPTFSDVSCPVYWTIRFYRFCLLAIEASSVATITGLLSTLDKVMLEASQTCDGPPRYITVFNGLASVAKRLHAAERVEGEQDRLAFLTSGLEDLNSLERHTGQIFGRGLDHLILRAIAEKWQALVTANMRDIQIGAQLSYRLITKHVLDGAVISLVILIANHGRGAATNIEVNFETALEDANLSDLARIERLTANEEKQVMLQLQRDPTHDSAQFRARFRIRYDDSRALGHVEYFAEVVNLLDYESKFEFIPNPYVIGTPLQAGSALFFGREDVFSFIEDNLRAAHRNNLILIGQRRTGKSSLLKQLPARLGDGFLAVYLDAQSFALDPGVPSFFFAMAYQITFALEDRGFKVQPLGPEDFAASPVTAFEHHFLPNLRTAIGNRHLVIMLDEFEELESAANKGSIDASVFGFLRHLVQHHAWLSMIMCGTHRMEELAADYWNQLFSISLYKHVGFLEQAEAMCLVQEPVAVYNMRYDDLALDKMWRVTAGHPYLLQLLCHSLVRRHNQLMLNYITISDLNAALDEILTTGEAHFSYLWTQSTDSERLILTVLCRLIPITGHTTAVHVSDYLIDQRNFQMSRRVISETLDRLAHRDILQQRFLDDSRPAFGWKLGLLALWTEKKKSLSRVLEEFDG